MKRVLVTASLLSVLFSTSLVAQVGNWYPQQLPQNCLTLYDIDMLDGQTGFAAGVPNFPGLLSGVIVTFDGGNNWMPIMTTQFNPPLPSWTVWRTISAPNSQFIAVAGDSSLVYVSSDGGLNWKEVSPTLKSAAPMRATIRSIYFRDAHEGFAVGGDRVAPPPPPPPGVGSPPNAPIIYHTTDFGLNWTDETPSGTALPGFPSLYSVMFGGGVWVACGDASTTLLRSGGVWSRMSAPSFNQFEIFKDLTVIDGNNFVISGTDPQTSRPRIYRTTNAGVRWISIGPASVPSGITDFPSNYFFNTTVGWIGTNLNYLGATINSGNSWKQFQVAGMPSPSELHQMDFADPLNGWAVGGDPAINEAWIIRYFGVPPKADISLSQKSAVFPDVMCDRSVEITVTVRNTGSGELVIPNGSVLFSSPDFTAPGLVLPLKLLPGRGKQITVRWTPNRYAFGLVQGSMTLLSNDPDHTPWVIALEGKRLYGTLDLSATIDVYPGICIKDSVEYTHYANTGGNRPPTFIAIEFVSGQNEFRLLSPKPGVVINGSHPFTFRFRPTAPGVRKGTYRFIGGNPSCPDTTFVDISGFGDWTKLTSNVTEVNFGKVCVNTLRDTTITLRNIGNTYAFVDRRELKSGVDMFPTPEMIPLFIKVDSSKKYRLQFAPQFTGTFTAEYRLINSPCPDTVIIRCTGEAISTEITFNPRGGVTVGPTIVGKPVIRDISVRNTGKTNANITLVKFAKDFPELKIVSVPPLPLLLPPGGSFDVSMTYNPANVGTIETQLVVAWNSVCADTARLDVSAPCLPNPYIDPPVAMDLGLQACSKPIRDTLYIRNKGNGPLSFLGASFSGADPTHFTLISPVLGDTAGAKDSVRLIVEFNRPTEGTSTAGLFLNHNDFDRLPTFIALAGHRTVSEFTVIGDSTTEYFTRIFVPQTRSYTLRNTSNQVVTITAAVVQKSAGIFGVTPTTPLPVTLQPNQSTTVDVVFLPNGRGPFNGLVRFTSQPCGFTSLLSINGRGDTDGLSVDRGNIDYLLDACSFTTLCDTLHLSNQGNSPVTVTGISITQTNAVFSIDPPVSTPFTLQGGQEQDIVICASPAFTGSNGATLNINSTDPVVPQLKVALLSHRDSSNVTVSVSEIDFGRMLHCSSGFTRDVTINNHGAVQEVVNTRLGGSSNAFLSGAPASVILQPGRSFTFSVTFTHPAFGGFVDSLFVSTDRCTRSVTIPLKGGWIEQIYAAAPRPLSFASVNIGTSSILPLNVQNNGGFDAHISSFTVQPAGEFFVQPGYPTTITAGNSISTQVRFSPTSEGLKSATACIIFDTPCPDTLCVDLQGTGVRGRIILSRAAISFGALAQCQQSILRDTLTNGGTGTINILSATISGVGSAAFANLTPVISTEALAPGITREFRIQYSAALAPADGPVAATLTVMTDDPIQPKVDIPLDGIRETLRPDGGGAIALGTVEVAKPVQRTVTLNNTGSARLCYSSDRRPSEVTYTPALPICIDPGRSVDVTITYTATTTGTWTGTLAFFTSTPCVDSTLFLIDARAQQGSISIQSSIDFGSDAWCSARTQQTTITNTFLQDATLDALSITGPDAAFFSIQSPTLFPRPISAGGSLTVTVAFTGQNLNRAYTATLQSSFTALGAPLNRSTALTALTVSPALSVTAVDFGTAVIGQPAVQRPATILNTSTIPVLVQSVTPGNPDFVVRSTVPPLPATLQPGQSVIVQLEFIPTQAKAYADSLRIVSTLPCPFGLAGPLTGLSIPQPIALATLSIGTIAGAPGDKVLIPVRSDKDLGNASVTSWSGSVSFNRSMLYPLRAVTAGTTSAGMIVDITSYVHDSGKVNLAATGSVPVAAGSEPLVYLECLVLLGDDAQTPLRISTDFAFTSGYATVVGRSDGTFNLTGYCISNGRLVTNLSGNQLMQNHPNPVSLDKTGLASISYSVASEGFVDLSLYDLMGRKVMQLVNGHVTRGTHEVQIDLSSLPAGVYQYTMITGDFTATRRLALTQ